MSFLSSTDEFVSPYAMNDCIQAVHNVIAAIPRFEIKSESSVTSTIHVNVSPGITSLTWGDMIDIKFRELSSGTQISITSTAKSASMFGSAQQSKNIQCIEEGFAQEIKKYKKIETQFATSDDPCNRLRKLEKLKEENLITAEEYKRKRAEIVAAL
jgi:hypothetical protein